MSKILLLVLLHLLPIGCSQKTPELIEPLPPDTLITYEIAPGLLGLDIYREYKVFVFADGLVVFDGIDSVSKIGASRFYISTDKVKELVKAFQESDFFKLRTRYEIGDDDCRNPLIHGMQATFSIQLEGKMKTVTHYSGCPNSGGQEAQTLWAISRKIEETTGIEKWVGRFIETKRNEVYGRLIERQRERDLQKMPQYK